MRKIALILLLILGFATAQAQDDNEKERIKSLKTAFITQELNFSNKTAQKFWPIYDKYDEKRRALFRREHRDIENVDCMAEDKAQEVIDELIEIEKQDYELKKKYYQDLKSILSAQEIVKLHQLEEDFHRKLIKEYRARKEKERKNNEE
ncbi:MULTISPECIES: hypothetical protein [unclassified Zunongwangia]|uniref:hypothetical protein n=1 Tax=unclassified Zunongwangia TaxID=2632541 RepID=UPI0022DDC057|nr:MULTISPECIES: hypothetical protein [unclassified Zunongwangia]WBL20977.1 hypothetical protein PBT89_09560 [Zunongwangia sp. HRR-M8]WBL27146.1 hypothetical protein PBT91_07695 [Zunongwangia sp. HGR-M22]